MTWFERLGAVLAQTGASREAATLRLCDELVADESEPMQERVKGLLTLSEVLGVLPLRAALALALQHLPPVADLRLREACLHKLLSCKALRLHQGDALLRLFLLLAEQEATLATGRRLGGSPPASELALLRARGLDVAERAVNLADSRPQFGALLALERKGLCGAAPPREHDNCLCLHLRRLAARLRGALGVEGSEGVEAARKVCMSRVELARLGY